MRYFVYFYTNDIQEVSKNLIERYFTPISDIFPSEKLTILEDITIFDAPMEYIPIISSTSFLSLRCVQSYFYSYHLKKFLNQSSNSKGYSCHSEFVKDFLPVYRSQKLPELRRMLRFFKSH
jgi:hypothetical protein